MITLGFYYDVDPKYAVTGVAAWRQYWSLFDSK